MGGWASPTPGARVAELEVGLVVVLAEPRAARVPLERCNAPSVVGVALLEVSGGLVMAEALADHGRARA